jgi:hypothetical protein
MKRSKSPTSRSCRSSRKEKPVGKSPTCVAHMGLPSRRNTAGERSTAYRWKAKYGGTELSEMQRLKQIEDENRRLKQIFAEQTLDI